jgi:hypothetical protein
MAGKIIVPGMPTIMVYEDQGPQDSEIRYTKDFLVYAIDGDSFRVGEFEIGQVRSPERVHGTPFHMAKREKPPFSWSIKNMEQDYLNESG